MLKQQLRHLYFNPDNSFLSSIRKRSKFDDDTDITFIYGCNHEKFVIWSHVAALLAPLIKPLLIFSSSIPTFFDLNWNDRLMCLKLRFFEIFLVHASRLADCDNGTIMFSNGNYISRDQLEIIYDGEFVAQLFCLCGCFKDLELSDSAIALFSALVLFSSDSNKKSHSIMPQAIQEKYKIYLSYQLYVREQKPGVYEVLLSMLPELQELGRQHLKHVKILSHCINPQASEPLLLSEVFDSTREEEIRNIVNDENGKI